MKNIYLVQPNYKGGSGKFSAYWLPYSVGSIWAYAKENEKIRENFILKELLFLREDVDDVISRMEHPDIVGFSNYIWNTNYNRSLARAIKSRWPETLIIFGGPEVPDNVETFYEKNPFIDIGVHQEAEHTFLTILLKKLESQLDITDIPGISFVHPRNGVIKNPSVGRIKDLEELPSPYLSGVFNDLLANHDSQWSATYETNRGCPYKCHFCDWGSATFTKVRKFSTERARRELEWIADNKIEYVFFADANFGIFKSRDSEIADSLIEIVKSTGYPRTINIQWAKNSNKNIVDLASRVGFIQKGITLSVQSMSENVLSAIERRNMAVSNLSDILSECNKASIPSYTELILGLPLETFTSWKEGWYKLLDLGQHCSIEVWLAQTLENSLLNDPEERSKYGIKTINAKGYFFGISESADPIETKIPEEIALITETSTLPFEDLIESYMFSWMMTNFHCFGWTQLISRFLRIQNNFSYKCFYEALFDFIRNQNESKLVFDQYNITKNRITKYLNHGDIDINLRNELGFEMKFVGHNLIYASQMVFRHHHQQIFQELSKFFYEITTDISSQLQNDLIYCQRKWIIVPGQEYPETIQVESNIFDYTLREANQESGKMFYELNYVKELLDYLPDISEISKIDFLNMFWMKRRWGPGVANATLINR